MFAPSGCVVGGTGPAPGGALHTRSGRMATRKLVLADKDRTLRDELAFELKADGYAVVCSPSQRALGTSVGVECPDAVILGDFDNPGGTARLIAGLRQGELCDPPYSGPVLALSRASGELALLRCYEAGADEFIAQPARYIELRARLGAVLARTAGERTPRQLRIGDLSIDLDNHTAAWADRPLVLSNTEFGLLAQLAEDPERLRTKDELLAEVWGYQTPGKTRTVDAHACRLRRKLAAAGADGLVVSRRGLGYRLTRQLEGEQSK